MRRATKIETPAPRAPSARDLYRDECAKVAADDPRWRYRQAPIECSRCPSYSSWVAPDGKVTCPGCWDWLADHGADALPALAPPLAPVKLPPGVTHPACVRCAAGGPPPAYDWGWDSRGRGRKRVLLAACSSCGAPCGAVDQKAFAACAPPQPPPEPETADMFGGAHQDPDDAVSGDALDVSGSREAQVSRADAAAGKLRLRVPVATADCASCGSETRGILWPTGMSSGEGLEPRGAGAVCAACLELERAEARAPMGLAWATGVDGAIGQVPVEEVGWRHEGDFAHEPVGYRGVRWADLAAGVSALETRRSRAGKPRAGLREVSDAVTGEPINDAGVRSYLREVESEGLDRWAVGRFACGAVRETKRRGGK